MAVIGLGLVGLLTVQLLKAAGCRVLGLDLNQSRSEMARQLGAELAFVGGRSAASRREVSQAAQAFTEGHGFDAVLITAATSSNEPVELAGQIARDRGRIVAVGTVGTVIPRQLYYEKELDFRISRSYGPGRYDAEYEEKGHDYPVGYVRWTENRNMQAFVQLLADGKVAVDPLITHHFPIEEASKAYDLITGYADTLGVVLTYGAHVEEERRRQTQEGAAPVAAQPSRGIAAESRESKARPIPITALGSGISIGVIGAGDFAKSVLLPGLKALPGVRLAAICSATGLSAQHAAKRFGIAACASDADAVLDDPAINAVVIATRHNLHASLAIRALQRGKHVFVEKPLALNEEELRAVVEASSAAPSTLLMVGYNRRFAPATREMLRFLGPRTGPLAVHYRVNAGYLPPEHWMHDLEEGGGRIVGELCHFVDWMQYVIGAPPVKVSAQALPGDGRYPAEDNVVVALSFADGSLGTIHYLANGDPREMKEYFELFCDGGVAVIEDFRTGRLRRNGRTRSLGRRLWAKQDKGHTAELQAFAAALRDGRASPVPLQEVVVGALATYKIREALRTGVSLGIHPEEVGVPPQEPPLARA